MRVGVRVRVSGGLRVSKTPAEIVTRPLTKPFVADTRSQPRLYLVGEGLGFESEFEVRVRVRVKVRA